MALIKCKECGKKYSDTIDACPHCGFVENPDYDVKYLEKCEVLYTGPKHSEYKESATPQVLLILLGIVLIPAIVGVFIIIGAIVSLTNRKTIPGRSNDAIYYDKSHKKFIIFSYRFNTRYIIDIKDALYIERNRKKLWFTYRNAVDNDKSVYFAKYYEMYFKAFFDRIKEIKKDIKYIDKKKNSE